MKAILAKPVVAQLIKISTTPKIHFLAAHYFLYYITPDTFNYIYVTVKYFQIIL